MLLCVLGISDCRKVRPGPGPSVLFVVIDTLRADRVARPDSPAAALGDWARDAAVFTNAESAAPFTMPSMAAMMTGLYPDRTGVIAHVPGTQVKVPRGGMLAETARLDGIATGAVVANPWLSRPRSGFPRGFDVFATTRSEGLWQLRDNDARTVTDTALSLLERWKGRRSFLWVHYFDPHMPYRPPARNAAAVGAPRGRSQVIDDFESDHRDLTRLYSGVGYDPGELAATRRLYDGEVNYVDEQLERLLRGTAALDTGHNTITVIVSDHGESLGEHGLFFAHDFTVYEELTHTVLMLRGPSIPAGRHDEPVSLIDVAPTLCRLLDLRCPQGVDGRDILGGRPQRERALFAAGTPLRDKGARFAGLQVPGIDGRWSMVRRGDRKLVEIPTVSGSRFELYDLHSDPLELSDLNAGFASDAQPRETAELRVLLQRWHAEMSRSRPAIEEPDKAAAAEDERTLRSLGYLE